jgi:hypothetical protein
LYIFPSLKVPFYSFFNLSESVNLSVWNLESRGFSIVPEMNFLGTIITGLLALILFKNYILKLTIFFSQVINVNTTILSLLILKINIKNYVVFSFVVYGFLYQFSDLIELIAPRLYMEIDSGFTRTIYILLQDHVVLLYSNLIQIFFGVPMNILPHANYFYASDIGWIILFNYGGLFFTFLFILFFIYFLKDISISKRGKNVIFILFLLFNFKGLVLGPNVFWFFLWMFHPYGYSVTFKQSLKRIILF